MIGEPHRFARRFMLKHKSILERMIAVRLASLCIVSLVLAGAGQAQSADEMLGPADMSSPEASVYSMMRAMYQGETDMIDAVFLETATLRRISADGEVQPDGLPRWREWVSTLEVGDAHEELFHVTSEQFGSLATVWAPFVITYQGEIAGCGINTFTLAEIEGDWRIFFGTDIAAPKDTCDTFRSTYSPARDDLTTGE